MKSPIMSGKEFVEHAKSHQGVFLHGNIAYDPDRPDIILFGPLLPFGPCPSQPLPRDKVTILRLGSTHPCGDNKRAWDADILLASPDPANHEAVALANLLDSLSHANSPHAARGHSESGPRGQQSTPTLHHTGHRTHAITESGNPAPATGWYVEILVLSTRQTWYYGPYANYQPDGLTAFEALKNPSTQWTALPQYITAGTDLQPW